jgi:hypothetical protein
VEHPTPLAYLALFLWPPLSLVVFSRRGALEGAIFTILGVDWILPVGLSFHVPFMTIARGEIAFLSALVGCLVFAPRKLFGKTLFGGCEVFLLILVLDPIPTALTNGDYLAIGDLHLPGLGLSDALGMSIGLLVSQGLPFILGRRLFSRPKDLPPLFLFLVGIGMVYAFPMLFEIVMSPQLHRWVYGYHPHQFIQQVRGTGYRPVVFVGHGLGLAFYMSRCVVSAAVLQRLRLRPFGMPSVVVLAIMWMLLLLGKSLAPILYGASGTLLLLLLRPKQQAIVGVVVAVLVLAYPMLRAENLVPTEVLLDAASMVSTDRHDSLEVRLVAEEALLERARQRIWFGWGSWGRNRVYDKEGHYSPPTDGLWAIIIGEFGIVGFLGVFGLLTAPVLLISARFRQISGRRDQILTLGLVLLVVMTAVDSIPNSTGVGASLFLAGALAGIAEGARAPRRPAQGSPERRRLRVQRASTPTKAPGTGEPAAQRAAPRAERGRVPKRILRRHA